MAEIYGVAGEYAAKIFGGVIADGDKVVVCGITQVPVLGNDSERVSLLFMNLSNNIQYVGMDEAVGSTKGIILPANGGFVSMNITVNPGLTGRAWHGLSAGANSNLYVAWEYRVQRISERGT